MSPNHQHEDEKLDETLDETFPASDAPANTVETGIHTGDPSQPPTPAVSDNQADQRFELTVDGHTAFLVYDRTSESLTLVHTEVPQELRGRHLGEALVDAALAAARDQGLRPIVVCPFARIYLRRHPPA
jgi:predicted GNAT family acetyltransferase